MVLLEKNNQLECILEVVDKSSGNGFSIIKEPGKLKIYKFSNWGLRLIKEVNKNGRRV